MVKIFLNLELEYEYEDDYPYDKESLAYDAIRDAECAVADYGWKVVRSTS